ncbi:hypothetical protein ACFZAM_32020 [Streptomyces sp. NPDC008079]|uniref:hypothetical protein n=1 Tax=Streptomyces sp. NPDC008079 TaxID=3364806 RepID=UPI0036E769DF
MVIFSLWCVGITTGHAIIHLQHKRKIRLIRRDGDEKIRVARQEYQEAMRETCSRHREATTEVDASRGMKRAELLARNKGDL